MQREVDGGGPQVQGEVRTAPVRVFDVVGVAESFSRKVVAISDQLRFRQKLGARQAPESANAAEEKRAVERRHCPPGSGRSQRQGENAGAGDLMADTRRGRSRW